MNRKTEPSKLPVILLAVACAVCILATLFILAAINSDKAELKDKQDILEAAISRRDYLQNMAANSDVVDDKIKEFSKMIPRGVMQNDVLSTVHRLGGKYEVAVSQVAFGKAAGDPDIQANKLVYTLHMEGEFENIMKMLEDLTGTDRFTQIESITLNGKERTIRGIKAQASVAVYYTDK